MLACRILLGQRDDLARHPLDALVKPMPVTAEVLDNPQHARREHIGALGQDGRQLGPQEMQPLPHRVSARAATSTDQIGETVASVLSNIAERFRGSAGSMSDEASKFGSDAAALGSDALRRLSKEVAQRPLILLGVAVAVGLLVGLAGHRR
jgi:ElaB/YqjD/DUF883 family membrane-anchored ribosome-binding protein